MNGYLRRYPGAASADLSDGMYHWQVRMLRSVLALTDMGLEDEGISERVRGRVLRTALYGSLRTQRVWDAPRRDQLLRRRGIASLPGPGRTCRIPFRHPEMSFITG